MSQASKTIQSIFSRRNFASSLSSSRATMSHPQQLAMVVGLCVFAVLGRLLIETPNFKPTMAVALISGFLLRDWRYAIAAPLFSMLLTDLWFGSYELPLMVAVYACMLMPVIWSRLVDRRWGSGRMARIVSWNVGGVVAAIVFFVVTNFVCWVATPWYPQTAAGLVNCYVNALPFLRWMILGNLLFVNLLASGLFVCSSVLAKAQAKVVALTI